jgi:signal transduction histidine kinase
LELVETVDIAMILPRVHPEDMAKAERVIGGASDGADFETELRLLMPSGAIKHVEVVGRRMAEFADRPVFLGCIRDITELTLAENELRRINGHLDDAHRLAKTGSISFDYATDTDLWSDETYRILEVRLRSKVTGATVASLVHPDDIPIVKELQDNSVGPQHLTFRVVMADGSVKWLNAVAEVTKRTAGAQAGTVSIQDVTEQRLPAEALEEVRSELAHVARVSSLGVLTASIAHEVNQPLSGIITNANTCLRMLAAEPLNVEGARETAKRTIRDGNRAADVIIRLRALFATGWVSAEPMDLNEATQEVIALSASELQRRRVILTSELAEGLPFVLGDRVQLQQVMLNLVLNAADALSEVADRPRQLTVRTELESDDRIRFTAIDNGSGFDGQDAERLFEAFHTTKPGGMGIGFSVSRSIIDSHGGRIWAQTNDGVAHRSRSRRRARSRRARRQPIVEAGSARRASPTQS